MNILPIKTDKDYKAALKEVEHLFNAKQNTADGDKLEVLTTLIHAYEEAHYPVDLPDAAEALHYLMESRGLERKDLEKCIGTRARVWEILNRKRNLTLNMIRKLHSQFHIPAELLIKRTRLIVHKHHRARKN